MAEEKPADGQPPVRVRRRGNELHVRDAEGRRVDTIRQGVNGRYSSDQSYGWDNGAYRVTN